MAEILSHWFPDRSVLLVISPLDIPDPLPPNVGYLGTTFDATKVPGAYLDYLWAFNYGIKPGKETAHTVIGFPCHDVQKRVKIFSVFGVSIQPRKEERC